MKKSIKPCITNQRENVDQMQAKLESLLFACSRDIRSLIGNSKSPPLSIDYAIGKLNLLHTVKLYASKI